MKIVRCGNGHFYDADKNSTCPYCPADKGDGGLTPGEAGAVRRGVEGAASQTPQREDPVVGWLVCTSGSSYGRSFELYTGRNYIGRSAKMDIRLTGDQQVAMDTHAIITYEPRMRQFFAQPGEARELVYVNDEVVLNDRQLSARDRVTVGNTTLVFVPFCGAEYSWIS